jgi:hypothetical protein
MPTTHDSHRRQTKTTRSRPAQTSGKLRIGDHWNAINIIALSQSNPLKAVAEFVENSIDAGADNVTIVRGKEKNRPYLRITDDGHGIPLNGDGKPDFQYVATHICDSIKRRLKAEGQQGIQGEFGIGLLSFWTVGEELSIISAGDDGKTYEMRMQRGVPTYTVAERRRLLPEPGTQLTVKPLLSGIRHFSGEKLQWYLASELRDRIRSSGVRIRIVDRQARAEFLVEPRQFAGRLLHHLPVPSSTLGEVYVELYLSEPSTENQIGLYRSGTRVLEDICALEPFQRGPWSSGYLEGMIDAPFLNLTPGTRSGVIHDAALDAFCRSLGELETSLRSIIEQQQQAEEQRASRDTLRSIQKAFQEALLALPEEEYDWFQVDGAKSKRAQRPQSQRPGLELTDAEAAVAAEAETDESDRAETETETEQKEFFEHAGPLFSVRVSPASCVVAVGKTRNLRAIPRDRSRRLVEEGLTFCWEIVEGEGHLEGADGEIVTFTAPDEPALVKVQLTAAQDETTCQGEALITVTDSLLPEKKEADQQRGLPGYTFQKAPGQLWRSRYDVEQNVIVINNAHRDFVYAARTRALKLRYICRLFSKELVYHNFPGYRADQLLERMIELSLYTEENLR